MAIGNNTHGNRNETTLVEALNNKNINEIPLNLKEFIRYICEKKNIVLKSTDIIKAKEESNNKLKQDLYIFLNGQSFGISAKMGGGNSVHQEKCADFIAYIKDEFNASDEICRAFSLLLWADGTIDGTGSLDKNSDGEIIVRFTSKQFRNKYPNEAKIIQKFLNDNAYKLINRFLFVGRHGSVVDFIYHGTPTSGSWIYTGEIINFQINKPTTTNALTVGRMSIQSWNASIKGTSENKRGQLQIKYGQMENDFNSLMLESVANIGTFLGDKEEYTFSRMMNKNKSHPYWKQILPQISDFSDYFIAVVDRQVMSSLSGKKVYTKTDVYAIYKPLTREFLLDKQYLITESDIKNCHTLSVKETGISVKMKDSKRYTLQKLTKDSFIKAVSPYTQYATLILIGLLLYSKESEMHKNSTILSDFSIDGNDFLNQINSVFGESFSAFDSNSADAIRKLCQDKLTQIIDTNIDLKTAIFTGKGWFESPYNISFIFKHNNLSGELFTNYSITTGSGRSSGSYNIEIKPK